MVTFDKKGITFDCEDIKARVEIDASKMRAQLEELQQITSTLNDHIMTIEEIIAQREKAANEAIEALVRYINAITEERNYYRGRAEELEQSTPY